MALDRLTKVDGGGISTTSDYRVGIITASKFVGPFDGTGGNFSGVVTATSANFTGNVTIGGTLTYEDVTNIDSVGVITARNGIKVSTGTATTALVVDGDARVTGILTVGTSSLKLDGPNNVVNVGTALTLGHSQGVQFHTQNLHSAGFEVNQINASGIITATGADINGNVSISGVTTITSTAPELHFTDTNHNSDYSIVVNSGQFRIRDESNSENRFYIASDGSNFLNGNVHLGEVQFGTGSRTRVYSGQGSVCKNALMVTNPTASVTGRGAGVALCAIGSTNDYIGTLYARRSALGDNRGTTFLEAKDDIQIFTNAATSTKTVITAGADGNISINNDLDVDGHTNLDNVSISGVTSCTNSIHLNQAVPEIKFNSTTHENDFRLINYQGNFIIQDEDALANRLVIESNGDSTFHKNVIVAGTGIRVENATNPFIHLKDTTNNTDSYLSTDDAGSLYLKADDNQEGSSTKIVFQLDGSEKVHITSTGEVNIGGNFTQTTYTAQVTSGSVNKKIGFGAAAHNDLSNEGSGIFFSRQSDGANGLSGIFAHTNDHLGLATRGGMTFHAGGSSTYGSAPQRMLLDTSGRLYLGSNFTGGNGDVDDLVISGTGNKGITVCSTSGGNVRITFADGLSGTAAVIGSIVYEHSVDAMDFYTNALRMMRVDRANSTERLQIGATNNNSTGTRLVLGAGNNVAATAVINTQDANINALTLSNWDGSTTTNKVNMHFDASGIAGFDVGIPAATTAFKIANTSGGGGYLNLKATGETMIYRSGVIQADINNSVSGHKFVSQCDDNNNGFEIYQQHGSTTTRNTLAVYNNSSGGSKHLNFYCRGDNQVFISGNKNTTGLVMDGTSSGTAYGETGNTIDFRMLNEVNQFTGNPAARIASYLERGNNGFGLKFYARNSGSSFAAMVQLSPDYQWEPCLDSTVDLGSDALTWRRGYIMNAYPEQGQEQAITGSSFSNGTWYDTGLRRNYVGGLDTNGTYIVTALADLYQAMGGNYSVTYTWIVGLRDQYTNQTLVNSCQLLSVCGHSTNNFGASGATVGDGIRLGTSRQPSSQGGMEKIVWKPAVSTGEINNTDGGRILRFRIQRIGRSSTG